MPDHEPPWRSVPIDEGPPLVACPFCASTSVGYYEHMFAKDFAVICNVCGAEGPKRHAHAEAARLWNRRASR